MQHVTAPSIAVIIPVYVEDGVTGFVVPVGDTGALAARIGALLSNPPLAARLGQAARERVESRHDYSRMMAAVRGVYDSVRVTDRWSSSPIVPLVTHN